ncbi:DUF2937 family protein [uncultured Enterovirga sp.]|uniref:DUF2937 family protein n=1 Tax=uncultured Enterovirga sp. TaxID=2026352 RepID=UPI0035CBD30F
MIARILAVAIGLFSGLAASQIPEFAQQYRQRLGGAIDELRRVMVRFDDGAQASGLRRADAIRKLTADPDPLIRNQGEAQDEIAARLGRLGAQRRAFVEAGPFSRLLIFIRDADPGLARATYLDYEPAWPATTEGVTAGGAGFLAGWGLLLFLSRIGRRLIPGRRRATGLRSA